MKEKTHIYHKESQHPTAQKKKIISICTKNMYLLTHSIFELEKLKSKTESLVNSSSRGKLQGQLLLGKEPSLKQGCIWY